MAKQKSIGISVAAVCVGLLLKTAAIAPSATEKRELGVGGGSYGITEEEDPRGLLHGLRYYVAGIGVIGLLIAVEDYWIDRQKKKKADQPSQPTPPNRGG